MQKTPVGMIKNSIVCK